MPAHGVSAPKSSRHTREAQLPPMYAAWVTELLGGPIPAETAATCGSCAMVAPVSTEPSASPHSGQALFFDPRAKCCTYIPELPNFLVGQILLDLDPAMAAGRASVVARLTASPSATPLGLDAPPSFALLYRAGAEETFGRAVDLLCPHYHADTGGCAIWRHRQAVCATWFCKHNRGSVGLEFWQALRRLLSVVERTLAVHCLRVLAPGIDAARHAVEQRSSPPPRITSAHLGGAQPTADLARQWGRYAGHEVAYYQDCAGLVSTMTWSAVRRCGGVEVDLAADVTLAAYRRLVGVEQPKSLRVGSFSASPSGPGVVQCAGYNGYDPITLPTALFDVLHVFDGRPVRRAMADAREAGVEVNVAVLRRLVDFGILIEAGHDAP